MTKLLEILKSPFMATILLALYGMVYGVDRIVTPDDSKVIPIHCPIESYETRLWRLEQEIDVLRLKFMHQDEPGSKP